MSKNVPTFGARAGMRSAKLRKISDENLNELWIKVRQNLDKGFSSEAEKSLVRMLENSSVTLEQQAKIQRLLSYTLETQGRYKESLEAVAYFDNDEILSNLAIETRIQVLTQLATACANHNDPPKAVALLEKGRTEAEENNLSLFWAERKRALDCVLRFVVHFI